MTPESTLSVLVGTDSVCFEVYHPTAGSLLWKDYALPEGATLHTAVKQVLEVEPALAQPGYSATTWAFLQQECMLAPARFFDPTRAQEYWLTQSKMPANHTILYDALPALQTYLVWPFPTSLTSLLSDIQPLAQLRHGATTWLEAIHRQARIEHSTDRAVFAHCFGRHLMVAVMDGAALRFFNTFDWYSARDFLYFTLLGCHTAQLSNEGAPLYLSGRLTLDSEVFKLLQRYFEIIHPWTTQQQRIQALPGISEDRCHWYANLISLRRP